MAPAQNGGSGRLRAGTSTPSSTRGIAPPAGDALASGAGWALSVPSNVPATHRRPASLTGRTQRNDQWSSSRRSGAGDPVRSPGGPKAPSQAAFCSSSGRIR